MSNFLCNFRVHLRVLVTMVTGTFDLSSVSFNYVCLCSCRPLPLALALVSKDHKNSVSDIIWRVLNAIAIIGYAPTSYSLQVTQIHIVQPTVTVHILM